MEQTVPYREMVGLNQSLLKKILYSPSLFMAEKNREEDSDKEHFIFGSLVDDLLLNPKLNIEDKYQIMEESGISDTLKSITQHILDSNEEYSWEDPEMDAVILNACDIYKYQTKWKAETRVNKIRQECRTYFHNLKWAKGKIIIPKEEYSKAVICVSALKADPYTSKYHSKDSNTEEWRHKIIQFEYNGHTIKGELDKVFIDHVNKTITPIDYKTTGTTVYSFNYDFWKFRYDFQAAVYYQGLKEDSDVKALIEDGYILNHFLYIVVEKEMKNPPMIFKVSNAVMHVGWTGGTLSSGRELEGFRQAIQRYEFHISEDKWDYPMEYYQKKCLEIEL
jgi:hypothetical protein